MIVSSVEQALAPVPSRPAPSSEAKGHVNPFRDNVEFLEAKSREVMLLLEQASLAHHQPSVSGAQAETGAEAAVAEDILGGPGARVSEASFKLERGQEEIQSRLATSDPEDVPFLKIVRQFDLDAVSQDVIWILFFQATSTDFRQRLEEAGLGRRSHATDSALSVGDILYILFPGNFRRQLAAREAFAVGHPLLGCHLLRTPYGVESRFSILELRVVLAPRIVQWISGDRNEYAAELPFTIERPATTLSQVVLSREVIEPVLTLVDRHREYVALRRRVGLDSVIEYGRAVVILEYGPPGTGKTMLARALSNHTGRPLVSLPLGGNGSTAHDGILGQNYREDLGTLFREAQLQGGIVFIDECEDVCGKNSPALKEFLIELEKSDALVMMTTNRPEEIAPAIDRRITLKVPFEMPGPQLRRRIWEILLPDTVPLADDVDLDALSRSYALTGGYIKNAVQTALNLALHRRLTDQVMIAQSDLEAAAQLQERQLGSVARLRTVLTPGVTLADCACSQSEAASIESVVKTARNLSGVAERWNRRTGAHGARNNGFKVLFSGYSYLACWEAAQAVAAELSLRIQAVKLHDLTDPREDLVSAVLGKDAALNPAAAVFSLSAESGHLLVLLDPRGILERLRDRSDEGYFRQLFEELALYKGTAIVASQSGKVRLPSWANVFHQKIEFGLPDARARAIFWRRALDCRLPVAPDVIPDDLAERYPLSPEAVRDVVYRALLLKAGEDPEGMLDLATINRAFQCLKGGAGHIDPLFG